MRGMSAQATQGSGRLTPVQKKIRWGGLALIAVAIAALLLGLPGAEVVGVWLFWLGLGSFVAMSVLAGVRETRRRRNSR